MPDMTAAEVIAKYGSVIVSGLIVGAGTLIPQYLERKKKKESGTAWSRIEAKMDRNHTELQGEMRLLTVQIQEVDRTATEALHHCVGPDGKNGHRSRLDNLEKWQESEVLRERNRLERIAEGQVERREGATERRGLTPRDVGKLNPEGA